jgi:hypothetical protein
MGRRESDTASGCDAGASAVGTSVGGASVVAGEQAAIPKTRAITKIRIIFLGIRVILK